jgi:filamentous hemagglutinin family protein
MRRSDFLCGTLLMGLFQTIDPAQAQMIPDRTLPLNSSVIAGCVVCEINGGTTRGTNLFHSFSSFSIPTNGSAYFNNAPQIQTLFTRVTGNQISNIDGLLRSNGSASLFLMNPNGIVFGPNASLNLGGSFLGTTANAIGFGQRETFSASNPDAPPLLTINPSALIFNQGNRGSIQSQANLTVPIGKNILLVGRDIALNKSVLQAQDGRIELGVVRELGSVGLLVKGNFYTFNFPDRLARGDISLVNNSVLYSGSGEISITTHNLDVSESTLFVGIINGQVGRTGDITLDATGDVTLRQGTSIVNVILRNAIGDGGKILVKSRSFSATDGSKLSTIHSGQGNAGDIQIFSQDTVTFQGSIRNENGNAISSGVISTGLAGKGNAGNIQIFTRKVIIDGGELDANINRLGDAGTIQIVANESIIINGKITDTTDLKDKDIRIVLGGIFSDIQPKGTGQGGKIHLSTAILTMTNGAKVSSLTTAKGDSGSIIIEATDRIVLDGTAALPYGIAATQLSTKTLSKQGGNGGIIQIKTGDLFLTRGAEIDTSTLGFGNTGSIFIFATNSIVVDGEASTQYVPNQSSRSGISATIGENAIGNGGIIQLKSRTLSLTNGGGIFTVVAGKGNSAAIDITAQDSVLIRGIASDNEPSIILSSVNQRTINGKLVQGTGRSGDIYVRTSDLRIENEGRILSSAISPTGIAADIFINAVTMRLNNYASIEASSSSSDGGDIFVSSKDYISMRNNSLISTSSGVFKDLFGKGRGGDIGISVPNGFLVSAPNENNDITANSLGGSGGIVTIDAQGIYWFTPRSRAELVQLLGTNDPQKLNTRSLLTNDISAISQNSPNLSGDVTLNTLGQDPSRGLSQLPVSLVDPTNKIDRRCSPKAPQRSSSFTITGTGGIPTSPIEALQQQNSLMELVPLPNTEPSNNNQSQAIPIVYKTTLVEAQGLQRNQQGELWLVAVGSQRNSIAPPDCSNLAAKGSL